MDVEGGWYHVASRGIERRAIFDTERDYKHFLELAEEMSGRYCVEVHAYCLMSNHYHLLIRTPLANASKAIQWLNVSYSVWFNRKRERVGHVFQGRFKSILIDDNGSWTLMASVYIHLNPIRVTGQGLGKLANEAEGAGLTVAGKEEIRRRLKALREYKWNSYRVYCGYEKGAEWLRTEELLERGCGRREYRRYVQEHVTRGEEPDGFEDLRGRLAFGAVEFQEKVRRMVKGVTEEQPQRRWLVRAIPVERIVKLVEKKRGMSWEEFRERHGDWSRDLVLYLARRRSGLTLRQIGEELGLFSYKTVGKAAQRFDASLRRNALRRKFVEDCLNELSLVET